MALVSPYIIPEPNIATIYEKLGLLRPWLLKEVILGYQILSKVAITVCMILGN